MLKFMKGLVASFSLVLFASVVAPVAQADPPQMRVVSKTYDPASMATLTGTSTTIVVPGAVIGDMVECSSSLDVALINVGCYVSAADTVTVRLFNGTAGTIDLASSTWRAFLFPKGIK